MVNIKWNKMDEADSPTASHSICLYDVMNFAAAIDIYIYYFNKYIYIRPSHKLSFRKYCLNFLYMH